MSDIQIVVEETVEQICDHFCKYSNTGKENKGCVWCLTHEDECPFDKLLEEVGLK